MVYAKIPPTSSGNQTTLSEDQDQSVRAGVIVPKREVRKAVDRNQVKRRLRHILQSRLSSYPPGTRIVVRALKPSSEMTSSQLAAALDRSLRSAVAGQERKNRESSVLKEDRQEKSVVGADHE